MKLTLFYFLILILINNPFAQAEHILVDSNSFYKYHDNLVSNESDSDIFVKTKSGDIKIPAGGSGHVMLLNESSLIVVTGGGSEQKKISVKENQKPTIIVVPMIDIDTNNAKASIYQYMVCYKVLIQSDFPDQLNIKITGPVIAKELSRNKGEIVYDITLNAWANKDEFYEWMVKQGQQDRYSIYFKIDVSDIIAPYKVSAEGRFIFNQW